jgi:hypothetical protein
MNIEIDGLKFKLIPLFHPAAIIYKRDLIKDWEKDMGVVKKVISGGFDEVEETVEEKVVNPQKKLF